MVAGPKLKKKYTFVDEPNPDDNTLYEYDVNLFSKAARDLTRTACDYIGAHIEGFCGGKTSALISLDPLYRSME